MVLAPFVRAPVVDVSRAQVASGSHGMPAGVR